VQTTTSEKVCSKFKSDDVFFLSTFVWVRTWNDVQNKIYNTTKP